MEIDDIIPQDIEARESRDQSLPITSTSDGAAPIVVYDSKPRTTLGLSDHPVLTDYGQMRLVEGCVNQDWWMSDLYRAHEMLLGLPWCSISVMVSLFEHMIVKYKQTINQIHPYRPSHFWRKKHLRSDRPCSWPVCTLYGLSTIYRIRWPPPMNMIQNSSLFSTYFDPRGNAHLPPANVYSP